MTMSFRRCLPVAGVLLFLTLAPRAQADSFPWQRYLDYPNGWFEGFEAKRIAANVISHQSPQGGWPKNIDTGAKKYDGDPKALKPTFEAGATLGELRFLARIYRVTLDATYRTAFEKGLKYVIDAQYPTGGWAQSSPPPKTSNRRILFEGNSMVSIMTFLHDVANAKRYSFVRKDNRDAARNSLNLGVECIVKSQILDDNEVRTIWCARHDERTLEPASGRRSDPAMLDTIDSAGILLLLMNLENPDLPTIRAVHAGCTWFENAVQSSMRVEARDGDFFVVPDLDAPPLWARYYEIGKNRPVFTTRMGVQKLRMAEIERERRAEMPWYGSWGQPVLLKYSSWKEKYPLQ